MPTRPKTNRQRGAPCKKNGAIIKRLIAAARLGLPYALVATRAGITRETLCQWRSKDADLDRQLEEARAEAAEEAWRKIMAAGETGLPGAWQSIAWRLERSHPESFARPEIQLNQINNSQTNVNATLVITAEVAEGLQKRAKAMDKELDELTKAHEAKMRNRAGTNGGQIREVETQLMSSQRIDGSTPITLPPPTGRHPNWWASLSRGDGTRPISVEAATFIIKTVAVDVLGAQRASGVKIDLDGDTPTLRDVWEALESLCGPSGWAALVKRGEG
jgi:hypothetical protein